MRGDRSSFSELGARRFEPIGLLETAELLRLEGHQREALELLDRAMMISRETGIGFLGPWILGQIAATTDDPSVRQQALEEGESILHKGAVSHSHLYFYQYAMEAALGAAAWNSVDYYAAALEDYTQAEPLPWSDFFIARGRTLASYGRGLRGTALETELERLRNDANRVGLRIALPALEAAALDAVQA